MLVRALLLSVTCGTILALSNPIASSPTLDCTATSPNFPPQDSPQWPSCASLTTNRVYWYLSPLGHGSSSSVLKATLIPTHLRSPLCLPETQDTDTRPVAIKIHDRKDEDEAEESYVRTIRQEYEVVRVVSSHPNAVQALELLDENGRWKLVLEYCEDSLMVRLKKGRMGEDEVLKIWRAVLGATVYMHNMGFAHRDLKAENILFCRGVPKLADFGSAVMFQDKATAARIWSNDVDGTKPYIAPEVWTGRYDAGKADVWQLGILLTSIWMRSFPWEEATKGEEPFVEFAKNSELLFRGMPDSFQPLLRRMLVVDPEQRADVDEILDIVKAV